ncbi:hypothetical protein TFLX_06693 [Thermoflexales bacterium]|nr:hypothetical protein TFLX_06693 [Thermoflexales bacterium]
MFSRQWLTLIILAVLVVLLGVACASNARHLEPSFTSISVPTGTSTSVLDKNPEPIASRFPAKELLTPTLIMTETFDCWTASSPESSARQVGLGQLLIAYDDVGASTWYSNLYHFNLATQKYSLLVSQIEVHSLSPDALKIWYSLIKDSSGNSIFAYDLANDIHHQAPFPIPIESINEQVTWSPDSQCLFAWRGDTAFAYRLQDGVLQAKTFPDVDFGFNPRAASPDGHWWAWDCKTIFHPLNPNEQNFCLITPQGQRVDHDGLHLPVAREPRSGFSSQSLGWWSPDSRVLAIAYPGHRTDYQDSIRLIYLDEQGVVSFQDLDFKAPIPLRDMQWSPDSRQLAFLKQFEGVVDVYDVATQQTTVLKSPEEGFSAKGFAWSPDGKQLVMVLQDKESKSRDKLYLMNSDGTLVSQIPTLPQDVEGAEMVAPHYLITDVYWVP